MVALHCSGFSSLPTLWLGRSLRRFVSGKRKFCVGVSVTEYELSNGSCSMEVEQRTEAWMEIRKDRLTASTFANALGVFSGKRVELWEEKVGLRNPFKGNQATRWGVDNEAGAVENYKAITGHLLQPLGFKIYKEEVDESFSWLGASPDGLIEGNESSLFEDKGVLEVKCPHMRGRKNAGVPWAKVPYYYIPQAQGLLEILDRNWMDFYVWTGKGSATFRITRDPEYWKLLEEVLSEFWWQNVVPARKAREDGVAELKEFKPSPQHPQTAAVIKRSKELAKTYPMIWRDDGGCLQPLKAGLNLTLTVLSTRMAEQVRPSCTGEPDAGNVETL